MLSSRLKIVASFLFRIELEGHIYKRLFSQDLYVYIAAEASLELYVYISAAKKQSDFYIAAFVCMLYIMV